MAADRQRVSVRRSKKWILAGLAAIVLAGVGFALSRSPGGVAATSKRIMCAAFGCDPRVDLDAWCDAATRYHEREFASPMEGSGWLTDELTKVLVTVESVRLFTAMGKAQPKQKVQVFRAGAKAIAGDDWSCPAFEKILPE